MSDPDVERIDDRSFRPSLFLTGYRPQGAGPFPAALWLHGGAWRMQDRHASPDLAALAARWGMVMLSADYRLSPEAPFPAQLLDVRSALRYIRTHARELRVDPGRIGLWGSSAGGHLAALTGCTANQRRIMPDEPTGDTSVQAVVDGYGPADLFDLDRGVPADHPTSQLLGGPPEQVPSLARSASPVSVAHAAAPPTLILHGAADEHVPIAHSERFFAALAGAGATAAIYRIEGFGHGFLNPGHVAELGPDHPLDLGRLEAEPSALTRTSATPDLSTFVARHPHASFATIAAFFTAMLDTSKRSPS